MSWRYKKVNAPALFTGKPVSCHQASRKRESKDYTFQRQLNEKPSIPGCPASSIYCILSHHTHGSQAPYSLQGIPDEYDEADINRLFSGMLNSH
jgi:hypothetical protein